MLIDEAPIAEGFIDLLRSEGITELYPPQKELIESGILDDGKNLVLSTPTASGKTLAAEIVMIKSLERGKNAVYVVPLRALAYEKFLEFRRYEKLGHKIRLEIGDMDSSKYKRMLDFDILVTTAEKCDSILRSRPEWFREIGILVMDEIHLINTDRGPVYEILISKFQRLFPEIQILALSATIGNPDELADWLNAKLIRSEWRPVKLTEKVKVGDKFEELKRITNKEVADGGQILIFVSSKRGAESVAEKLGEELRLIRKGANELNELRNIQKEILSALNPPTRQCKRLASCVVNGTAFHHSGLVNKQRTLIENSFKEGLIKVIIATPTLAAGVNLPSRTVIIRDIKRYEHGRMTYIPVLEYKQQVGRAGRPRYDKIGNAITLAKTDNERDFLMERYILGEPEPIYSRLGVIPVLRFHILASIASNFANTEESLLKFFRSTFFGYQYGSEERFQDLILDSIDELKNWNFIRFRDKFLLPTKIGARISELYIDPQTAHNYISLLKKAESMKWFPSLGLLEMLCDSLEMPLLWVNRWEEQKLLAEIESVKDELLRLPEEDSNFLERFKTARVLYDWIDEYSEEDILRKHRVTPGLLNQKLQIAEWLAYSASEISKILGLNRSVKELKKLEMRIRHGVKEELIPLVMIKGIGRVRARRLWNAGFKKPGDLKNASVRRLTPLLGERTAEKIKMELE